MNEELVAKKKAEILDYERILNAYRGRWYDQGRRHLEALREELKVLESDRPVLAPVSD